jgi:predicted lipid-binding transport protein (Tim44 family)
MMKWMAGVVIAAMAAAFVPDVAEAKRLGGGSSKGMQRSTPTQPAKTPDSPPAQQATPGAAGAAPAAAGAAAAAGKRSWMGPLAGLAAGLGLAALFSAFGLGDEMGSLLLMVLLAVVVIFLVRRFLLRPAATPALAGAGAGGGMAPMQRTSFPQPPQQPAAPPAAAPGLAGISIGSGIAAPQIPADFDRAGFERIAKAIFIRMQAANDVGDVNDLRQFTTPELFAELRLDLQERGAAGQHTDVLDIQAEVIDFADEAERQVVSVRYRGRVQEEAGAEPVAVDEIWHLVKPRDDSRNWAIAGIQQGQ